MKSKLMIVLSMFAVLAMSLVGGVSAQETFDNIVDALKQLIPSSAV